MATDFRTLDWLGSTTVTAQPTAPAGFTAGRAYQVKAAAVDNASLPPVVYALIVNDSLNVQLVPLPLSGAVPFTFQ